MKRFAVSFFSFMILCSVSAQTIYTDYWDGVVYFKIRNDSEFKLPAFHADPDESNCYDNFPQYLELLNRFGVQQLICPFRTKTIDVQNIYRMKFTSEEHIEELIKALLLLPEVEYAEKSPILRHFTVPDDPDSLQQYYLSLISAPAAWNICTGSPEIKIAIVDDAVRVTHPDLVANIWVNPLEIPGNGIDDDGNGYIDDVSGWDAADDDNDPDAPLNPPFLWEELAFTHGTHCAGLAAGVTNNGIGIASVSYNVSLIPIKAVSNTSWLPLSISAPAEGVDYAIAAGAHIVSMSFGGEQASGFSTLETLINAGHDLGIIFVAAAGNNGDGSSIIGTPNAINYPAGFENVIAVGATNANDIKPGFSQYGNWIDVMAPGVGIYSTLAWSSPYGNQDGTSMACPIVAGTLGLMKSYMPMATKEQLIFCLKQGCDNIDALNPDFAGQMGAGRINVYNSLICLQQYQSVSNMNIHNAVIFPNPAEETLNIQFRDANERNITITDISGRTLKEVASSDLNIIIHVSDLQPGMYICMIEENGLFFSKRIIITR